MKAKLFLRRVFDNSMVKLRMRQAPRQGNCILRKLYLKYWLYYPHRSLNWIGSGSPNEERKGEKVDSCLKREISELLLLMINIFFLHFFDTALFNTKQNSMSQGLLGACLDPQRVGMA